jgi:uncharacterized MAPEG superfamily protein
MTVPVWVLLAFAGWTLLTLVTSVGVYRIGSIFTGRVRPSQFSFPDLEQSPWHRRAMRAHLNCVENLPVYGAVVVAVVVSGLRSPTLDRLAITFFLARMVQTIVHLAFPQRNRVTAVRFAFFTVQLVCMIWMGIFVAVHAA